MATLLLTHDNNWTKALFRSIVSMLTHFQQILWINNVSYSGKCVVVSLYHVTIGSRHSGTMLTQCGQTNLITISVANVYCDQVPSLFVSGPWSGLSSAQVSDSDTVWHLRHPTWSWSLVVGTWAHWSQWATVMAGRVVIGQFYRDALRHFTIPDTTQVPGVARVHCCLSYK